MNRKVSDDENPLMIQTKYIREYQKAFTSYK